MEKSHWSGLIRALGLFSTIISEIAGGTIAGILLGYGAWKYLDWPRPVMLFTALAGFAVGLYRVVVASQRVWKETDRENDERNE